LVDNSRRISPGKWPKPPELALKECVTAEQSVELNPFSKFSNDFFMVTKYEEDKDTEPEKKDDSANLLIAYLVMGVFLAEDNQQMNLET